MSDACTSTKNYPTTVQLTHYLGTYHVNVLAAATCVCPDRLISRYRIESVYGQSFKNVPYDSKNIGLLRVSLTSAL